MVQVNAVVDFVDLNFPPGTWIGQVQKNIPHMRLLATVYRCLSYEWHFLCWQCSPDFYPFHPIFRKLTYIQSRKKICPSMHLFSCTVGEMITFMPLLLSLLWSLHIAIKEQDSLLVSPVTPHCEVVFKVQVDIFIFFINVIKLN